MKSLSFTALTVFLVLAGLGIGWGVEQKQEEESQRRLMQKKLEHAQGVLTGLSIENFQQIVENAQALNRLTEKQWRETDSDEYRMHLKNFRFAAGESARLAGDKNLDGAALAYMQLTMSCVGCHKHLRDRGR